MPKSGLVLKMLFAIAFFSSGRLAHAYDPNTDSGGWNDVSKIEVRLPDGSRKFVSLMVQGSYGKDPAIEMYSPYIKIETATEDVLYPFVASAEVKAVLCELANGVRRKSWETEDPSPPSELRKPTAVQAVTYGPDGFAIVPGQTRLAANVPCLKSANTSHPSFSLGDKTLARIEMTRKSDGSRIEGELRGVASADNPFGRPYFIYTPQIFIDGNHYDIWGGQGLATGRALCKLISMDDQHSGTGFRISEDDQPVVVFKEGKFVLYDTPESKPKIATSFGCGRTGGDGSH